MFEINSRSYGILTATIIYLIAAASALTIATVKSRANADGPTEQASFVSTRTSTGTPFFSLSTHRTFGTDENPRLWLDYHDVDHLDFRVYQVQDPIKFLAQLRNPHQMGEREQEDFSADYRRDPSLLERIRAVKRAAYSSVKTYVRSQLHHESRKTFNQKFRSPENPQRTPLNISDYARVPLLNPSQLVSSWREPLTPLESEYDRRQIPLGKRPAGVYLVEAVAGDLRAYTIAIVTELTVIDKTTRQGELLVYAVNRRTGEPRPGTQVEVIRRQRTVTTGVTDTQGILRTGIDKKILQAETENRDSGETDSASFIVLARQKDDFAISDLQSFYFLGYQDSEGQENIKGYIYTDRPVYRPKQKIFFKGIVRAFADEGGYKSVADETVHVTVQGPNNGQIFEQSLNLSPHGTFHGQLETTSEVPLGHYHIVAEVGGGTTRGIFEIAEYKKPEYKVKLTAVQAFVPAGDKARVSVDARYFFGAPVANAEVKYYVYRSRYYPWGESEPEDEEPAYDEGQYEYDYGYGNDMVQEGDGKLDTRGHFELEFQVPAAAENDPHDYRYIVEAQVIDSARRTLSGSTSVIATRGNTVTKASPERYVYKKGDKARIGVHTSDYEGRPLSARVELRFIERTWVQKDQQDPDEAYPQYDIRERELSSGVVTTDASGNASYEYYAHQAGSVSIKTIVVEGDRKVVSWGGNVWVTADDYYWSESSFLNDEYGAIKLVPDKKSYRAGETARVLAILPTDNAHLLVTTELASIKSAWQVSVTGRSAVLEVPITSGYSPNVFLNISYVKNGEMFTTDKQLLVPPRDKMLNIEVISNKKEYKPRETASYTVLARDANGAPVHGAEISLAVVDEAIYSMAPDYAGNIQKDFYALGYNAVDTHFAVYYVFTGYAGDKPMNLARNKPSYQLADFKTDNETVEPLVRKDFKDTAFWQPDVITGADGRATVKVKLPDNLTTWRATARGVTADTKVGATNYKVLARKDVIIRLETPRFITQGDTVTLSGIVHNYLKADKVTQISLDVVGAQLLSNGRQTVTITKEGEHRIDWQVTALNTGQVKVLAKALTNTESDAVELPLEVVPRGLKGALNETWTTGDESAEKSFVVNLPSNADARSRKLRIEVAPSITGALFGALDYLTTYPYGCTEQTMSSFLPNVVVTQALKSVKSTSIRSSNDLKEKVKKGTDRLYSFQHADGGWGWWKDDQSDPFMTAYVIAGLMQAKQAGYDIDDGRIASGREKLRQMLLSGKTDAGTSIDLETRAFMVYSLFESGGPDGQMLDQLFKERGGLQPYGRALLALSLHANKNESQAREVANEIEQSATVDSTTARWTSTRKPMLDFAEQNDVEANAFSVKALARIKPNSLVLTKAARTLAASRRNAYFWNSTKDTAFAISGLIDYVRVSSELTPAYNIEVYLNGETIVAQSVNSTNALKSVVVTRAANEISTSNQIRVVKRGKGILYFSTSLEYHTDDENVPASSSPGLNLSREYFRLRVTEDGYKLKWALEPLTGDIHSGDLLVVRLRLNGNKARHVMIEDPIPAGAEQVENVGSLDLRYNSQSDWSDWYSAREFRDQRTLFFVDYFDGSATFQYALRVQVPGDFRVAPARTELMYSPDVKANTASTRLPFLDRK